MKTRKLSAQEENRLAVQLQYLRCKLVEFSLRFTFHGKSTLWGNPVDELTLTRERAKLAELYRIKGIFESAVYRRLPYFQSNGSSTQKVKERYKDGLISFVEVKPNSHGQTVIGHLAKPKTLNRRIKRKQTASKRKTKQLTLKTHNNGKKKD